MDTVERKTALKNFLEEKRAVLLKALTHLKTEEDWHRQVQTSGEEWTALHMIRHLQDAHTGLTGQAHRLIAGTQTVPRDFDVNRWNTRAQRKTSEISLTPDAAIETLKESHENLMELIDSIQDADWKKTGWSAALQKDVDLERFIRVVGEHEGMHAADIETAFGTAES